MILYFNNKHLKSNYKNNYFNNYNLYYSLSDVVNDEKRGYLYYKKTWIFCGLNQISKPNKTQNLIILLESPHKKEYDSYGNPLRPANGRTGFNINNKLSNIISNLNINFNKRDIYTVWIMNAIQYQTSAYNQLHNVNKYNKNWRKLRNNVFKTMWDSFSLKKDLIKRINSLPGTTYLILNCVTGGKATYGLRSLVSKFLKNNFVILEQNHPSTW